MLKKFNSVAAFASDKLLAVSVLTVGLLAAVGANAQSVDPFDAALTTATTKVGAYAAALVGLAAVSVVFMIGMKYVKRIPRAA